MNASREEGMALLMAILCVLLLTALGAGLVLNVSSETMIAANYRDAIEGLYAADAAATRAVSDLLAVGDWSQVLSGGAPSGFTDGLPSGTRSVPGGPTIDLVQATNMANCGKAMSCSDADLDAIAPERPWGRNNPRWMLYAYGRLADMLPGGAVDSPYYVVAFAGDDPAENDDDPSRDGTDPLANGGSGIIAVRAESFGPRGSHKVVELSLARADPAGGRAVVRVLSWRELR
jgi:hypothetical protein